MHIYFVKYEQTVQKLNSHFSCFVVCFTSKHKLKQALLDSPFNFVKTLIERIYSKVNATFLMFKKPIFTFSAKGYTRHLGQKMASPKKNEKLSNFLHTISDVFAIILA